MFDISLKIVDNLKDDIRPLLMRLNKRTIWNNISKENLRLLKETLAKKNYITFAGHTNRYHLRNVGESCLYDIPTNRRGALAIFRGKRVRIVCVRSGRYDRVLMAGEIK
jgi:hypothetical protein